MNYRTFLRASRTRVTSPAGAFVISVVVSAVTGCASIDHSSVMPRNVSQRNTVTAACAANGCGYPTSKPSIPGTCKQCSSGQESFVVQESTHFPLSGKRLINKQTAAGDVSVVRELDGGGSRAVCSVNDHLISAKLALQQQSVGRFAVSCTLGKRCARP